MKTITVQPGQSMADVVIMACGTLEGAMAVMKANNESLTATAIAGAVYTVPDDVPLDSGALRYLKETGIQNER